MGTFGTLRLDLGLGSRRPLFVGPLDPFAGQLYGAFSLVRLLSSYTGPVLRSRRDSDGAQSDFFATPTGALITADGTDIATWCGAGGGFLVTWYDQTGGGRHWTQVTTAQQPRLVSAGVLVTSSSGRPAAQWDGVDDSMRKSSARGFARNIGAVTLAANIDAPTSPVGTQFVVCHLNGGASIRAVGYIAPGVTGLQARRLDADSTASLAASRNTVPNTRLIWRFRYQDAQADIVNNGTINTQAMGSPGLTSDTDAGFDPALGSALGSVYFAGKMNTVVEAQSALDIPSLDAALAQVQP